MGLPLDPRGSILCSIIDVCCERTLLRCLVTYCGIVHVSWTLDLEPTPWAFATQRAVHHWVTCTTWTPVPWLADVATSGGCICFGSRLDCRSLSSILVAGANRLLLRSQFSLLKRGHRLGGGGGFRREDSNVDCQLGAMHIYGVLHVGGEVAHLLDDVIRLLITAADLDP